ncbi:MAG: hypothetical protein IPI67_17520 [Myxococcales bacterium]|nr:hypothetical protein [Myxococcales bacterium]
MSRLIQQFETDANIEQRRGLRRRPSRREVVASLVWLGVLAGTFGKVQHNGGRSPSELIDQMAPPTRQRLNHAIRESQEVQGQVINVEPLVIEHLGSPVGSVAIAVANVPGTGTFTGRLSVGEYEDTL